MLSNQIHKTLVLPNIWHVSNWYSANYVQLLCICQTHICKCFQWKLFLRKKQKNWHSLFDFFKWSHFEKSLIHSKSNIEIHRLQSYGIIAIKEVHDGTQTDYQLLRWWLTPSYTILRGAGKSQFFLWRIGHRIPKQIFRPFVFKLRREIGCIKM